MQMQSIYGSHANVLKMEIQDMLGMEEQFHEEFVCYRLRRNICKKFSIRRKEDLKAYHDAKKYGDFSVATGRSVEEIKYIAEGNDMDVTHMIGFNGAVVTRQDEVLFEKHIPTKDLTGIFE